MSQTRIPDYFNSGYPDGELHQIPLHQRRNHQLYARLSNGLDDLSQYSLIQECEAHQSPLGIFYLAGSMLHERDPIEHCLKDVLRKTDLITSKQGGLQIYAPVNEQVDMYIVANKIRFVLDAGKEIGMVTDGDIHMTYVQSPGKLIDIVDLNLPEDAVELMDIALGIAPYDSTKQVYVSSTGRIGDIVNYLSTVDSLDPQLLESIEVAFTPSTEIDLLGFRKHELEDPELTSFQRKWQQKKVTHFDAKPELDVTYDVRGKKFVIKGYQPGRFLRYDKSEPSSCRIQVRD